MSLNLALSNALSGLRVGQRSLAVLSHNIANANTENYARQAVQQSAVYVEGVGNGVRIGDVQRTIDTFLRRSILTQGSISERSNVIDDYHDRLQVIMGDPSLRNTLDEGLTQFFNTLQQTAETSERASLRSNAINNGVQLTRQISEIAFRMEDLRLQADQDISEAVATVNGAMQRLERVNIALASASVLNASTAGLEDERDTILREISERMDITTFFESTGAVNVYVGNGQGLVDGTRRELRYVPAKSVDNLANDATLSPLQLVTLDAFGAQVGEPKSLITAGQRGTIKNILTGGSITGLQKVRDEIIPEFLSQLDTLVATLRDTMNAIQNDGVGFPPPQSLTGTRAVKAGDSYDWSGSVRLAVLKADGQPVPAAYGDEQYTAWRPLTLNFGELDSGLGKGKPNVQSMIDEINNHFRAPSAKVKIGDINNIQIVSNVARLPTSPVAQFTFDLDVENISRNNANMFITGITVRDDTATNITNISQNVARLQADSINTYTTTAGSREVVVRNLLPANVAVGDKVFLNAPPAGLYNGIPSAELGGYFTVKAVNGVNVTIEVATTPATATASLNQAGIFITPKYDVSQAGEKGRTKNAGTITADLTANVTSQYYDITLDVGVQGADGLIKTSTITYRINNNDTNLLNDRYDAISATGEATRVIPSTTQDALRAIMVDKDGIEIPKVNGAYLPDVEGFLKLVGGNTSYGIAIDELDSKQLGKLDTSPQELGSNRGWSHFFELNNLFKSNKPTATGDTVQGSAYRFAMEERVASNPNLLATGGMERQRQPTNPNDPPQYTYVRYAGNNSVIQRMAQAGTQTASFAQAGGLPNSQLTFTGYAGELLGFMASKAAASGTDKTNAEAILSGFKERSEAVSNVNLDEELANTIIYQNAYAAAARMVNVVNQLFDDLLSIA
jgi:flagellar hook-associated protein FlgK